MNVGKSHVLVFNSRDTAEGAAWWRNTYGVHELEVRSEFDYLGVLLDRA